MKLRTMLLVLMGSSILLGSLGCRAIPGRKSKIRIGPDGTFEIEIDDTQVAPNPPEVEPGEENEEKDKTAEREESKEQQPEGAHALAEEVSVPVLQIDPSLWGPRWTDGDWQEHPLRVVGPLEEEFEMEEGWIDDLLDLEVVFQFTAPSDLMLPDSATWIGSYEGEAVFEVTDTLRAVCLLFRDDLGVTHLDLGGLDLTYGADTVQGHVTTVNGDVYNFAAGEVSTYLE